MTARTLAYLTGTSFVAGQAASNIGADDMRDLVDTIGARTSRTPWVTWPEYGADPTGATDSTAAFHAALAASKTIIVPPGIYKVNNVIVPTDSHIIGFFNLAYQTDAYNTSAGSRIIPLNSSTPRLFNVSGALNIQFDGLMFDGQTMPANAPAISSGGFSITCKDCCFNRCQIGFGGPATNGLGGYSVNKIVNLYNCVFFGCDIGMQAVVDCYMFGGSFSGGRIGVDMLNGTGGCSFTGTRVEWTDSYGFYFGPNVEFITITGCQFDHTGNAAIYLGAGTRHMAITGCHFARNGHLNDSNSCHIYMAGASNVVIMGNSSSKLEGDDVGNGERPNTWFRASGTNTRITVVGNDLTGHTAIAANYFTGTPPTNYVFASNQTSDNLTAESADGTIVTTAGPAIVNGIDESWTLVSDATVGLQIAVNGVTDINTGYVVKLLYLNHKVYQYADWGTGNGWWFKNTSSDPAWTATTDPNATTSFDSPPLQAVTAGFTNRLFFDDFTTNTITGNGSISTMQPGINFYPSHGQPGVNQSDPTNYHLLTTTTAAQLSNGNTGGGNNASPNGGIVRIYGTSPSVQQNQSTLQGVPQALIGNFYNGNQVGPGLYGPQGYWEGYVQYNTAISAGEHISFWANCIDWGNTTELDIMEQGLNFGDTNWRMGNLNNWSGENLTASEGIISIPSDAQWHTMGILVKATSGGQGTFSVYLDNVLRGSRTIGAGTNWPGTLTYPRLWLLGKDWGAGNGTSSINFDWVRFWGA